ncbi:hypothetical protein ACW5WK_06525 [Aeromonas enteropelogenes]|uniref:hypothetical protein n=1 Tax=Aeromonas enteropelogenes TaxID=29489 RepID=UPI002E0D7661
MDAGQAQGWSEQEVAERWAGLFQWPLLDAGIRGDTLIEPELSGLQGLIEE